MSRAQQKNFTTGLHSCGDVTADEVKFGGIMAHVHTAKQINSSFIKLYQRYFIV